MSVSIYPTVKTEAYGKPPPGDHPTNLSAIIPGKKLGRSIPCGEDNTSVKETVRDDDMTIENVVYGVVRKRKNSMMTGRALNGDGSEGRNRNDR
jgi:hypothetical protein